MFVCKIADFIVQFNNRFDYISEMCRDYKYSGPKRAEIIVEVSEEELSRERDSSSLQYSDGYLESVCAYRKLCLQLPCKMAILLHGSVISVENKGIAFIAKSGVGKTTHTNLWRQYLGDKVTVINGDKPIVRILDNVPFAYGTPWAGKERMQTNSRVELTDICIIERSEVNSVESVEPSLVVEKIMHQILRPSEAKAAINTLEIVDLLTKKCRFWVIKCNMNQEAAELAHMAIVRGNKNEA